MSRLTFDLETDGLLDEVTTIHCIATQDVETLSERLYSDIMCMNVNGTIREGTDALLDADLLIGHNLINYDCPVFEKVTGISLPKEKIFDTLVACRLVWSNIQDIDYGKAFKYSEPIRNGAQSLHAWGVRLGGAKKIQYQPVHDPSQPVYDPSVKNASRDPRWKGSIYTPAMGDYCIQDVRVNTQLFNAIERKVKQYNLYDALELEHKAAWLLSLQERNGFRFDERKAQILLSVLSTRKDEIYNLLITTFGGRYISQGLSKPKRTINYKDPTKASRVQGAEFTKIEWVDFNPSSRAHIIRELKSRGWVPSEFTPSGEAKVDETILSKLAFPEGKLLAEWFMLQKRLGQLSEGKLSWLSNVTSEGYIHGSINPNGAVTGRSTHSRPNIGQIPSLKSMFGKECRELFIVPDGWVLMGSDAAGLELRCLAEALSEYDGGAYIDIVLNGDIHVANQLAAGLKTRDEAKRFVYSFLYGCGVELTGEMVGWTDEEFKAWKASGADKEWMDKKLKAAKWRATAQTKEKGYTVNPEPVIKPPKSIMCNILKGTEVQEAFMKGLPALQELTNDCKAQHVSEKKYNKRVEDEHLLKMAGQKVTPYEKRGHIVGLDGRKIYTRSAHAALNTKLQGMGALICKAWIVEGERLALAAGYKHGSDGDFMQCAFVHDEVQIACRTREIAQHMGELYQQAMRNTQAKYGIKCRLDTDFNIGASWAETH